MLRKIILHGNLAVICGAVHEFDIETIPEAIRALVSQFPDVYLPIHDGEFQLFIQRENEDKTQIDEAELSMELADIPIIHIVPVVKGSKKNGVLKVVLGIALLGIGFGVAAHMTTAGAHALLGIQAKVWYGLGAGLLLQGIGTLLSPSPTIESNEKADERQSYLFSSSVNICEEGNVIPCAYGSPFCSSLVVSSGMDVEDVDMSLSVVSGFSASTNGNTVYLTWAPVTGAVDYVIRYGGPDATWDNFTSQYVVSGTSGFRTLSEGTYKIMIKARSGSVYSSDYSTRTVTVDYTYDDYGGGGNDGD